MIRIAACLMTISTAAQASTFCEDITRLEAKARAPSKLAVTISLPETDVATNACAYAQGSDGARFIHCAWPFDFRAPAATSAFERVSQTLLSCPDAAQQNFEDQTVNHPDSYTLRIFDVGSTKVSLSLKDKGALQKTFVFIRVE